MRNPVKAFRFSLFVLLFLVVLFVFSLAAADRVDIKGKIFQYCESELGYSRENLTPGNLVQGKDGKWTFSCFVKNPEEMTDGLVLGILNQDGTLNSITAPSQVSVYEWLSREIRKSLLNYQDIYHLKQLWEPRLDSIPEEETEQFVFTRDFNPIIDFLLHDIVLPDEKCIPYEEALEKSMDCIGKMNGWTEEMSKHIDIIAEAVHVPAGMDHPVYHFVYTVSSDADFQKLCLFNEEYTDAFEKKNDEMIDEEKALFGDKIPYVISIKIDAHTGEQIGDIYTEIPPVSSLAYSAIILWK